MEPLAADELASLYEGSLENFVTVRGELAKKLSAEGRDAEAAWVRKLRKPNLAAWATNQLAHKHHEQLSRLIDVWDRLGAGPGAAVVAELTSERKKVIGRLLDLAKTELASAGKASPATLEKVAQTLNSGVVGEGRERLLAGVLERELEPAGFDSWTRAAAPVSQASRAQHELDRARAVVEAAQEEADRAARRVEEAEAAIERAIEAAESARARSQQAQDALEEARSRLPRS